jgi:hypothetical protein
MAPHVGDHAIDLLIRQGGKVKKIAPTDTAFIERKIEQGNARGLGHRIGDSDARIRQQIADQGAAPPERP